MYIGAVLNDRHHITVAFMGHDETITQYKAAVAALARAAVVFESEPIAARLTGELEKFGRCWVTLVDSPQLVEFRKWLVDYMELESVWWSEDHEFRPHVTMTKYGAKPKKGLTGELKLARLSVVSNTFGTTDILIGDEREETNYQRNRWGSDAEPGSL